MNTLNKAVAAVAVSVALTGAVVAGGNTGPSNNNGPTFGGGGDQEQSQGQGQHQGQGQAQGQFSVNKNSNDSSASAKASSSVYSKNSNKSSSYSQGGKGVGVGIGGSSSSHAKGGKGGSADSYSEGSYSNSKSKVGDTSSVSGGGSVGNVSSYSEASDSSANNSLTINEAAKTTTLTVNEADIPNRITYINEGTTKIRNTPNVGASALTSSNGTCMGSSSIGGSGPGLGLSLGTTWTDDGCTHRYNAEMMYNLGHAEVATKIMCREESVRESAPELCGVEEDETGGNAGGSHVDDFYYDYE